MHITLDTMVTDMLKIDAEQQDCLYKLKVMAGIRSADVQPLLPLPPLPKPLLTTTNLMQPLLETMDAMPTRHLELQRVVDEQQATEMPVSQPEGPLELLPTLSAPTSATEASALISISKHLASPLVGATTGCGHEVRPAPSLSAPTTSAAALCGPNTGPAPPTSAPMVAIATGCGPDWIRNDSIDAQFIGSEHEPLFLARLATSGSAQLGPLGLARLSSSARLD
jgi:hypothetical protein